MDVFIVQQLVEINKLNFNDFDWFSSPCPFKVNKEHTLSEFCDCESVQRTIIGENDFSTANESRSSWPVNGVLKIVSFDNLDFIKHFWVKGIVIHCHNNNSSLSLHLPWVGIHIYKNQKIFNKFNSMNGFSSRIERSIDKGFERSESGCIKVNLSIVFACWNSEIINPWVLDFKAVLSVQNWRELGDLVNRTVMFHLDNGLELLDYTSWRCENVLFHVGFWVKVSLVLQMVDNSNLVSTFVAVFNCVVQNTSVEPCAVIKDYFFVFLFIVDLFCQEIGFIKLWFVNHNFFWVVGNFNAGFWQVMMLILGIVSVSNVKVKIGPTVFENQDWNAILSEHHKDWTHSDSHIIGKNSCNVN